MYGNIVWCYTGVLFAWNHSYICFLNTLDVIVSSNVHLLVSFGCSHSDNSLVELELEATKEDDRAVLLKGGLTKSVSSRQPAAILKANLIRTTMDNITVGNDLSVKPYTPSWIDQAHWDNMIDRLWNTSRWKKKSNVARQNRLTEVNGEVSKHTAGSKTILQHKFQMNVVEAAMEEKHGPDASDHPPNDFDLWGEATGGKKKGKLVGLGTRGDPRVMVTRTSATSSFSSTSNEQVYVTLNDKCFVIIVNIRVSTYRSTDLKSNWIIR
ncbi:transposase, Ptta/En/Spm [Tanacetum coccineum]